MNIKEIKELNEKRINKHRKMRVNGGYISAGTVRIARIDIDTNPPQETVDATIEFLASSDEMAEALIKLDEFELTEEFITKINKVGDVTGCYAEAYLDQLKKEILGND